MFYSQDYSITNVRPMNGYWVDASTAADGVTWRDSSGAVVNVSTWLTPGFPSNQSYFGMCIYGANLHAYDFPIGNGICAYNKIWCVTVVH